MLEALVHLDLDHLLNDYIELQYEIPDDAIEELKDLPDGWDALPPYNPDVQAVGDAWAKSLRSLALRVPSSVYPVGFNVLINPAHPRFSDIREVKSTSFAFPSRLIGELRKHSR